MMSRTYTHNSTSQCNVLFDSTEADPANAYNPFGQEGSGRQSYFFITKRIWINFSLCNTQMGNLNEIDIKCIPIKT